MTCHARARRVVSRRRVELQAWTSFAPPRRESVRERVRAMKVVKREIATEQSDAGKRLSALSMYSDPPDKQISITEFEEYAFDRLRCMPLCAPTCCLFPPPTDASRARAQC